MPIEEFNGDTFVAFLDISGFKELMRNKDKALKALNRLYQQGYEILSHQDNVCKVEGIFISDSGVLFVRRIDQTEQSTSNCLKLILKIIKRINEKMIEYDFMLTTSIAYGNFSYQNRIEFEGIEKNAIYGNAYISAFLDNENGRPKIQPGQCRIVKKNLPCDLAEDIDRRQNDEIFRMIKTQDNNNKHYYFYWMRNNPAEIESFEQEYNDAFNLKYSRMLKALKGNRQ